VSRFEWLSFFLLVLVVPDLAQADTQTHTDLSDDPATAATNDVAFDPGGTRVATVTTNNDLAVFSVASGQRLTTLPAQDGYMSEIDWTSDGNRIVTVSRAGTISMIDLASGSAVWTGGDYSDSSFRIDGGLAQVELSPNGETAAALQTFPDSVLSLWNSESGALEAEIPLEAPTDVFVWSESGESLYTANHEGSVVVVSARDGSVERVFDLDLGRLIDIDLGAEGLLALGGAAGVVSLLDTKSGSIVQQYDHGAFINRVALDTKKGIVAAVGGLGNLKAWALDSGKMLFGVEAHRDIAYYVSAHPDSNQLATVGEDNVIRFWDSESGELRLEIKR